MDAINGKRLACSPSGRLFSNRHPVEALVWGESIQVWTGEWEFATSVLEGDGYVTCHWESNVKIFFHLAYQ